MGSIINLHNLEQQNGNKIWRESFKVLTITALHPLGNSLGYEDVIDEGKKIYALYSGEDHPFMSDVDEDNGNSKVDDNDMSGLKSSTDSIRSDQSEGDDTNREYIDIYDIPELNIIDENYVIYVSFS